MNDRSRPMHPKRIAVLEMLEGESGDQVLFDGLDDAIVGIGRQFTSDPLVVYDEDAIIEVLMRDRQIEEPPDPDAQDPEEEARDFYGFNIQGTYAGPGTPLIVKRLPDWQAPGVDEGPIPPGVVVNLAENTPEDVSKHARLLADAIKDIERLPSGTINGWTDDGHFMLRFETSHVLVAVGNKDLAMASEELLRMLRVYAEIHACFDPGVVQ